MHLLLRTRRLPLLMAALFSLTLLTSSVLAVHVHNDGLPHYSDCDTCLQLSGLDSTIQHAAPPVTLEIARPDGSDHRYHFNNAHYRVFQARAPPVHLTQH